MTAAARKCAIIGAVLVVTAAGGASAQGAVPSISVQASADKVGVGETFEVVVDVSVEGARPERITLPDFGGGFAVKYKDVSSPMQFSFGFGQKVSMTYKTSYTIGLQAVKEGKWKLGPVVVRSGGKEYQGETIVVQVTKEPQGAGQKPAQPGYPVDPFFGGPSPFDQFDDLFKKQFDRIAPPPQPAQPPEPKNVEPLPPPPPGLDGAVYDQQVFVRTVVEPKKLSVGQQADLSLFLYTRVSVGSIDVTQEPQAGKFWTKDLLTPTGNVDFGKTLVEGVTFNVATIRKTAIFPTEAGTLVVGPAKVTVSSGFGGLFGGGDSIVRSGVPLTVEVSPLPAEGVPPGFDPANVGSYAISMSASTLQATADQPVTLTMTISGTGNIEMVRPPAPKFPDWVKSYDPQSTDSVEVRRFIVGGTKKVEHVVIPSREGTLVVEPVPFSFFDPAAGAYRTVETARIEIAVAPSPASAAQGPVVSGQGAGTGGTDGAGDDGMQGLHPILTVAPLRPASAQLIRSAWFVVAIACPPALLVLFLLVGLGRAVRGRMRVRNPAAVALPEARRLLKEAGGAPSPGEFYARIQKAIYGFVEMRLGAAAAGMTGAELRKRLAEEGLEQGAADRLCAELENCEFARYGRSSDVDVDKQGAAGRVGALLEEIDRKLQGRGGARPGGAGGGRNGAAALLLAVAVAAGLLGIAGAAEAASVREMFDEANGRYFKGDYKGAIEGYYGILDLGIEDPALYFNAANAFARLGEHGKAVYFYERVLRLEPRDDAAQKNLSIVRAALGRQISAQQRDASVRPKETLLEGAVSWFTANELVLVFLFFYYLFFAALLLRRFERRQVARIGITIAAAFFLLLWGAAGTMVVVKYDVSFLTKEGVVIGKGLTPAREGPTADANRAFDVAEGQRVEVKETKGDWQLVEDDRGRAAWLLKTQVGVL